MTCYDGVFDMFARMGTGFVCLFSLTTLGCSATGAAWTGVGMARNLKSNNPGLGVSLDGIEAKRNQAAQAAVGHSKWKVKGDVSATPTLKFTFKEPEAIGRIRSVVVTIHKMMKDEYSDQAEFTIVARDSAPEAQMQPDVDYNLASPGSGFRVTNWKGDEVSGVQLELGKEYMLTLSVGADGSETAQVHFAVN
jgi:hypothetical protein